MQFLDMVLLEQWVIWREYIVMALRCIIKYCHHYMRTRFSLCSGIYGVCNKYLKNLNFCLQYLIVHGYFDRAFHIIFSRYQIIAATVVFMLKKMQISAAVIYAKDGEKNKI